MNGACPLFTHSREDGYMCEEPEDEECGDVGRCDPHDELANNHQSAINNQSSVISKSQVENFHGESFFSESDSDNNSCG